MNENIFCSTNCLSIFLGYFFGNFIYKEYDSMTKEYQASSVVYYLQQGVYKSDTNYKKSVRSLESYTAVLNNDKYYVYVGITNSYSTALKIKNLYKEKGIELYIKEDKIKNDYFISDLNQYSNLLKNEKDFTKINSILKAVLASYEENVLET